MHQDKSERPERAPFLTFPRFAGKELGSEVPSPVSQGRDQVGAP